MFVVLKRLSVVWLVLTVVGAVQLGVMGLTGHDLLGALLDGMMFDVVLTVIGIGGVMHVLEHLDVFGDHSA